MTAGVYTLEVDAGANKAETLVWFDENQKQVNVANYAAALQVRASFEPSAPALLSLTNASGITLGNTAENIGQITVQITATQSAQNNLANEGGEPLNVGGKVGRGFLYDLVVTSPEGFKTRIVQGEFRVWQGITR